MIARSTQDILLTLWLPGFVPLAHLAVSGLHAFEINLRVVRHIVSAPTFETQMRDGNEKAFFEVTEELSKNPNQTSSDTKG